MTNYRDWNQALVFYFTSGLSRGTRVYLSIDEDILEHIGRRFNQELIPGSWGDDFREAVSKEVIVERRVDLSKLQGRYANGLPKGVAFLSTMILAANEMADEENISERDYFRRLREILNLPGWGRPPGMNSGSDAEEPLWQDWNHWLMENGFIPSAQRGRGGRTTYINYPISQSLLRRVDRDRLLVLFNEKQWKAQWDAMSLFSLVLREEQRLPKHLRELLTNNRERYEAVAEAIHEVYQQWQAQGRPTVLKAGVRSWSRHIFAGLYRDEDQFFGSVNYYLYPKQVRGRQLASVKIQYGDRDYRLINDRPGWYLPLDFPLSVSELNGDVKYPVVSPSELESLVIPSRDFWILIPDPDNPDAGTYASWGQPSLGTQFILLCKKELLPDIERLRNEHLIKWSGEVQPFDNANWIELHQCMVISQAWDAVFIKNQALKDALQPSDRLSISFAGGLRVPQQNAWLQGHVPNITVFGFYPKVQLQITRLIGNFLMLDKSESTNTQISVEFLSPGDYLISATCVRESTRRFIKIVDWNNLVMEKPQHREIMPIGSGNYICGSVVKPISKSI